ncbi:MAG: hypothetical protein CM15mP4_3430 [Candidatus Neomarinimicrobiota bacterium]|nr:MAG: hypothetical protein CM15mP4_3430 [Candidatus Neomarinimicrobiota bacterium]
MITVGIGIGGFWVLEMVMRNEIDPTMSISFEELFDIDDLENYLLLYCIQITMMVFLPIKRN